MEMDREFIEPTEMPVLEDTHVQYTASSSQNLMVWELCCGLIATLLQVVWTLDTLSTEPNRGDGSTPLEAGYASTGEMRCENTALKWRNSKYPSEPGKVDKGTVGAILPVYPPVLPLCVSDELRGLQGLP